MGFPSRRIAQLEAENAELRERLAKVEQMEVLDERIAQLEAELDELHEKLKDRDGTIAEQEKVIAEMEAARNGDE